MKLKLTILWFFNLFDTIATLYFTNNGMIEANPIMAVLLQKPFLFVFAKLYVITLACVCLYAYKNLKLSRIGANVCFAVYGLLTIYHIVNFIII